MKEFFRNRYTLLFGIASMVAITGCEVPYTIQSSMPSTSSSTPPSASSASPTSPSLAVGTAGNPATAAVPTSTPNSSLCITNPMAAACDKTPQVKTPGVVTILFTMGEIPQASATLILANAIKYASPIAVPKILFLKDSATNGEDEGDPDYIKNKLLLGYDLEYGEIAPGGISPAMVAGKDLVIISNPGYPLSDKTTLETLLAFKGGVILLGDDMSQGDGFSPEALTGLKFKDNGSSMSCNGHTYDYDNLKGYSYRVALNSEFLPGIPAPNQNFQYGNDLDWTEAAAGIQVLAWATAAPGTCDIGRIPAVVRHEK